VSTETVGQSFARARFGQRDPVAIPVGTEKPAADECLDFVRFCYRRRRVSWPALYDEMAAVAARGVFHGLGFAELAERGVCFSLPDLPRLAALTEQVMLEERSSPEPHSSLEPRPSLDPPRDLPEEQPPALLVIAPARG
jgi:hypothetical protein